MSIKGSAISLWLAKMPLASAPELAALAGCNSATATRRLNALRALGFVDCVEAGRLERRRSRWYLTSAGIQEIFPENHAHTPGGLEGQWHPHSDPLDDDADLVGDDADHGHPRRCITAQGIKQLSGRLEVVEAFYTTAARLFHTENGRNWLADPVDCHLEDWHWLAGGGLVDAVGVYNGNVTIGFCWIGKHLKAAGIRRKWDGKFIDRRLAYRSEAMFMSRVWYDQPDPDWDHTPHLSGYVIMCTDRLASIIADHHLPRGDYTGQNAFLFANPNPGPANVVVREARVIPRIDKVVNRSSDHIIGRPGIAPPGRIWGVLNGRLATRLLGMVEEWDALTLSDIRRRSPEAPGGAVSACLREFEASNIVIRRDGVYYLARAGAAYVAQRDGIHSNSVLGRVAAYHDEASRHHAHQRRHNRGVNKVVTVLQQAGIEANAGWRAALNFPGVTQIVPDMVIVARVGGGIEALWFIEYETSAKRPAQVERKLMPYIRASEAGHPQRVIFVCGTHEAERLFQRFGKSLPLLTTIFDDVMTGRVSGDETVWRLDGQPVSLWGSRG